MSRQIPSVFRLRLQRGYAIAGICLIRLEHIRPPLLPRGLGLSSENAAHRVAVLRGDSQSAVFIPRRDSDSWLNHLMGGRLFPGEHHRARFSVEDDGSRVHLKVSSVDREVSIEVDGLPTHQLPKGSVFGSVAEASRFFETGPLGYSTTRNPDRFDGMFLETQGWSVEALDVTRVASSYFEDSSSFPNGSAEFDHALIMRNLRHEWRSAPDLYGERTGRS